jgi:zinc protease
MGVMSFYGAWTATGAVQTDQTKESVAEVVRQLHLLQEQPISQAEMIAAKRADLQHSASTLKTSAGIASQMGLLWSWHLPMTALQGESEGVQQTGLLAVRAAVARYADPKKASLLVVGD